MVVNNYAKASLSVLYCTYHIRKYMVCTVTTQICFDDDWSKIEIRIECRVDIRSWRPDDRSKIHSYRTRGLPVVDPSRLICIPLASAKRGRCEGLKFEREGQQKLRFDVPSFWKYIVTMFSYACCELYITTVTAKIFAFLHAFSVHNVQ